LDSQASRASPRLACFLRSFGIRIRPFDSAGREVVAAVPTLGVIGIDQSALRAFLLHTVLPGRVMRDGPVFGMMALLQPWPAHIFQFFPGKALLYRGDCSTISSDNLVSILSRVAEGKGPLKPQQPVGRKADAGAKSHPVRPGEIRSCSARLFFSTPGRGFFIASPTPLATMPTSKH
jgi:hypothetical protein